MKSRIATVLTVASLVVVGTLVAEEAAKKVDFSKIKCVVSGKAVNPEATADYKDAKVYFCCEGCPALLRATPRSSRRRRTISSWPPCKRSRPVVRCPAKRLDPETTVEVAGVKVNFCCGNCQKAAASKKGDEQVELIFNDKSFEKGFEIAKKSE